MFSQNDLSLGNEHAWGFVTFLSNFRKKHNPDNLEGRNYGFIKVQIDKCFYEKSVGRSGVADRTLCLIVILTFIEELQS